MWERKSVVFNTFTKSSVNYSQPARHFSQLVNAVSKKIVNVFICRLLLGYYFCTANMHNLHVCVWYIFINLVVFLLSTLTGQFLGNGPQLKTRNFICIAIKSEHTLWTHIFKKIKQHIANVRLYSNWSFSFLQ